LVDEGLSKPLIRINDRGDSMIEVRVFATLRQGREKITLLPAGGFPTAADVLRQLGIPAEAVSILLINGFHSKPENPVKDGDILALFPPVGGG